MSFKIPDGWQVMVAPSILSADFRFLGQEIDEVARAGAQWLHIDVMDGIFVPNITIGPLVLKAAKAANSKMVLDVHLMIERPERYLSDFRVAGADNITVHAEACIHLHRTIQQIKELGAKAGVALNPHTPENVLDYVLPDLDLILVMSVNPGFGGQKFIDSSLQKITRLRSKIDELGLDTAIVVDGGVNPQNASILAEAGAHVLVAGNAVFGVTDRKAAVRQIGIRP